MSTGRLGAGDTAIQPTIFDAKADILTATAADTPARLAVGSNGQYLKADSTTATGLAWATLPSSGKVLQVVQGLSTGAATITSTSLTDTNLSVSITPSATTSKILVLVAQQYRLRATVDGRILGIGALIRGTTNLTAVSGNDIVFGEVGCGLSATTDQNVAGIWGLTYLDSPSTTSSTTYKTQAYLNSTTSRTLYFNTDGRMSMIIAMEIGA